MDTGEVIGTVIGVGIVVVVFFFFFGGGNFGSFIDTGDSKLANSISDAIEPDNPSVRAYALSAIKSSHGGQYNIAQICDIYDKLYKDWVYVSDPNGIEYVAPASESVRLLRGDCDDYAVLMASLIESIGGGSRVVCAWNDNSGHAYAEVYLSNSKSSFDRLIDDLGNRYRSARYFNYHEESESGQTKYWLNLDWTARYPGGEFYKSSGDILVIYPNGYYERMDET